MQVSQLSILLLYSTQVHTQVLRKLCCEFPTRNPFSERNDKPEVTSEHTAEPDARSAEPLYAIGKLQRFTTKTSISDDGYFPGANMPYR